MPRFNDGRAFAIQEQTIQVNRRSGQPVQFVIQNTDNEKLKQALPRMLQAVNNSKILQMPMPI